MTAALQRATLLVAALGAVGLLSGCAGAGAPAWTMQPVLRSQDAPGKDASSYYALGRYHQQREELDAAASAFEQAIALAPHERDARNALAVLYARRGQLAPAQAMLAQLNADFPQQAAILSNLGYIDYLRGDLDGAVATLRQALLLDATQPHLRANLALAERALRGKGAANPAPQETAHDVAERSAAGSGSTTGAAAVAALAVRTVPSPLPSPATTPMPTSTAARTKAVTILPAASPLELVQLAPHEFRLQQRSDVAAGYALAAAMPAAAASNMAQPCISCATPALTVVAPAPAGATLQIVNGDGARGVGLRVQRALDSYGIASGRVLEQRRHYQRRTILEYLPGQQARAVALLAALRGHATLIARASLPDGSAMRLVLGHDVLPHLALIDSAARRARPAAAAPTTI